MWLEECNVFMWTQFPDCGVSTGPEALRCCRYHNVFSVNRLLRGSTLAMGVFLKFIDRGTLNICTTVSLLQYKNYLPVLRLQIVGSGEFCFRLIPGGL